MKYQLISKAIKHKIKKAILEYLTDRDTIRAELDMIWETIVDMQEKKVKKAVCRDSDSNKIARMFRDGILRCEYPPTLDGVNAYVMRFGLQAFGIEGKAKCFLVCDEDMNFVLDLNEDRDPNAYDFSAAIFNHMDEQNKENQ